MSRLLTWDSAPDVLRTDMSSQVYPGELLHLPIGRCTISMLHLHHRSPLRGSYALMVDLIACHVRRRELTGLRRKPGMKQARVEYM